MENFFTINCQMLKPCNICSSFPSCVGTMGFTEMTCSRLLLLGKTEQDINHGANNITLVCFNPIDFGLWAHT